MTGPRDQTGWGARIPQPDRSKPPVHDERAVPHYRATLENEHARAILTDDYLYVDKPDAVVVVAIRTGAGATDLTGRVLTVAQHRKPLGYTTIELPGGGINDGETIDHAAIREVLEETGCAPDGVHDVYDLGMIHAYPALSRQRIHLRAIVAATWLEGHQSLDVSEAGLAWSWSTPSPHTDEMREPSSIIALYRARERTLL